MDGNPRPRNPNGLPASRRPSNEQSRRPPGAPGGGLSSSSSSATASAAGMSRAERFDDERRRITDSCFAKVDDNGQLIESYITHIRVQEDAAYPQSPPPPNSNPSNKKARVIIVSVRSSGRVRLHKARENANGTFSIGKTWNLEDVTAVETFTHLVPATEEEAQRKAWAGDTGFTVTIAKPYYWEAGTPKEKEFFIGSMIKIYHKYTQGKFPELSGFGQAEMDALMSGRPTQSPQPRPGQMPGRPAQSPNRPGMISPGPPPATSPLPGEERERRPPPLRDDRRPPPLSDDRRPTPLSDSERRPPPLNDERRPTPLNDASRRPPPLSDDRRPPPRSRPTTADEERRPPPRRPPTAEGDRRPPPLRGPPSQERPPTAESDRRPPPLRGPAQALPPVPPLADGQRQPRPRPSMDKSIRSQPSREQLDLRSPPSRDQMRPMPGSMPAPIPSPTPPPAQHLTPQSSASDFVARPKTPESASASSIPASISPGKRPQDDARSLRSLEEPSMDGSGLGISAPQPRRPNGYPSSRRDPSPRGLRPGTAQSNASSAFSRNEDSQPEPPRTGPPERRRPPMLTAQSQRSVGSESNAEFITPAQSPAPPSSLQPGRGPQRPSLEQTRSGASEDMLPGKISPEPQLPKMTKTPPPSQPPPISPLPQIPKAAERAPPVEEPKPVEPSAKEPEPIPEPPSVTPASPEKEPETRAGLGSMIKKKSDEAPGAKAADAFRKAAFAVGAFKPRAGGAAEKLFNKDKKVSDEPDGITGVFVPQRPAPKEEEKKEEPEKQAAPDRASKERPHIDTEVVPAVTVSSPLSPPAAVPTPDAEQQSRSRSPSPGPDKRTAKAEAEAEVRRKKRRSNQQIANIRKLGIEPSLLDGRALEFEALLSDFGWGSSDLSAKSMESLEQDIKREIARVEAGSWLNHLEQKDDRVEAVEKMLDRAIAECDELEGLLTLYNVELSSLNDDIAFIEAQSQGLQVQTANQKLLQSELQQLVDTISITSSQLEPLRRASPGKVAGLMDIEASLVLLYKALMTIDPAIVQGSRAVDDMSKMSGNSGFGNSEVATMRALQEKKDRYLSEAAIFLNRIRTHLDMSFAAAFQDTQDSLARVDKTTMPSTKLNIAAHDKGRDGLWMFSPIILFAKEVDRSAWDAMIQMYQTKAAKVYQEEIRDNILSWRRFARKPTGEEQELLFTAQEKESESIGGAARKLTVKRSQTLARGLRSASGEKEGKVDKNQSGKLYAFDVFSRVLEDIGPVLLTEQNFVTDFFHATSSDAVDFPDAVKAAPPDARRPTDLYSRRIFESDRAMAKRVAQVMEDIFSFWPSEIQSLVEWAVKADPLQGVGILCAVDRKLVEVEDSNQDFLTRTLQGVHERLNGLFVRFVDEQIRAIEDTKVKIKKRKGVIAFMKTFPHFSMAIENMLPAADEDGHLEIRKMVDDAYQKINRAMFESLKVIAKESPAVMGTQGQGDPEDKEALNYHILLIENMNHYLEEVDTRSDPVLRDWRSRAEDEMREHMNLYVDAVVRRPLGKLLEFIESTETLLSQPGIPPTSIATRSSHSRSLFKKLVHANDAKEIRKGIEALKKRVDKHFGDADDPSISRDLVFKVLKECEKKYADVCDRTMRIGQDVYAGEVEMDWSKTDIGAAFGRGAGRG